MNSSEKISLCFVDDDPGMRTFIETVARQSGYDPHGTNDPVAFCENVRAMRPSVIVLDLMMPRVDGIELLRTLASTGTRAKILIASGSGQKILESAMQLGRERGLVMAGTIEKPIRAAALRAILESLLPEPPITSETLRAAIAAGDLTLHYQPKLDLATGRIAGVEALARWPRPEATPVSPAEFIPIAEESGLISDLTTWVLADAVAQAGRWRRQGHALDVSINLSWRNLTDLSLPDRLVELCASNDVPPSRITLELTETANMRDATLTMDILTRLRLKGFSLSMDDFGIGFSSLAQLRRLPFSEIKIDQSFVMTMIGSRDSAVIVKTIIGMGKNLDLAVVAEGVETREALRQIAEWGCDIAQGFGIGRPTGAEKIVPAIEAWTAP